MKLSMRLRGRNHTFKGLYDLMAKANEPKSGDRLAGLAAGTASERMAAKFLLADVPVGAFVEQPAVPAERDLVTRSILGHLDAGLAREVSGWSLGELRERLLEADSTELSRLGKGLTSEAIAGVTRLMSNLDLISTAARMSPQATCRTTVGRPGTLSSRLQPNHPTDDPDGILASVREGLSYASGDAMIGINPNDDTVASVSRVMDRVSEFVHDQLRVPTQVCVLAHASTQMEAIRRGARCDLLFQSISGTQKGCEAFGISPTLLQEVARRCAADAPTSAPTCTTSRPDKDRSFPARRTRGSTSSPSNPAVTAWRAPTRRFWSTPWSASSARNTCTTGVS